MIPTLNVAGAEKFVVDLALNVDRNKFNISVGVLYKSKKMFFIDLLKDNNINIVDLSGKNKFEIMKNIKNYFKNNKVDILHTNLNTILYTMFYVKKYKIEKRLYTFHTIAEKTDSKLKMHLYKYAFNKLNFIPVAISDFIKDTIVKEFKLFPSNVECVYNGVDVNKFTVADRDNEKITLINVGRLNYIKNHVFLIKIFKKLIDKGYDLKLLILGDGELREELENLVNELNLQNYVELKGVVNNVNDYLLQADIYCGTSLYEGLPITQLEAMACGMPIVSSKAGGVVDIVKNGINGYICEEFDEEKYSQLVEKLILDEKLRIEFGKNSRKIAEELSVENCASNYEKIYLK